MADLLALVAAWQCLPAWPSTARYGILTRLSRLIGYLLQWRLPTGTVRNDIRGPRAMRRLHVLRVTFLFAFVDAAIELTLAEVAALEHTRPALDDWLITFDNVLALALPVVSAITAKQLLFDLPAIALG